MGRETEFTWSDRDTTIRIAGGVLDDAAALLAESGFDDFELVTSSRAAAAAPRDLTETASRVHEIPAGAVPELAATLLDDVGEQPRLVALGGGRVVDTAKAVAAVRRGVVAAIPTTLSGAEMTSLHRLPAGVDSAGQLRPEVVLVDPELLSSVAEESLRSSAGNALAHGIDALIGPRSDAETVRRSISGAGLIANALDQDRDGRDLTDLALGSALCAIALERGGLSIQHVLAQTLVFLFKTPHSQTHTAVLPHSVVAIAERAPDPAAGLAAVLKTTPSGLPNRIRELGGSYSLGELGVDRDRLGEVVELCVKRLSSVPGEPPDSAELLQILEAAF